MPHLGTSRLLTLGYAVLAVADTWLAGRGEPAARRARHLTKPLLMPTLAASLASDPRADASPLRATTLAAQIGGWGGDLALLRHGTQPFLAGAGSFALGHAAYVTGFLRHAAADPLTHAAAPRRVAALTMVTGPAVAALAARQQRVLGLPVLGYAAGLGLMVATANHLDTELPRSARVLTGAGAALFLVSDTVLATHKFATPRPPTMGPTRPSKVGPPAGRGVVRDVRTLDTPVRGVRTSRTTHHERIAHPERMAQDGHVPVDHVERLVMATYTLAQLLLSQGAARARLG